MILHHHHCTAGIYRPSVHICLPVACLSNAQAPSIGCLEQGKVFVSLSTYTIKLWYEQHLVTKQVTLVCGRIWSADGRKA